MTNEEKEILLEVIRKLNGICHRANFLYTSVDDLLKKAKVVLAPTDEKEFNQLISSDMKWQYLYIEEYLHPKDIEGFLNEKGSEGWELVFFKRLGNSKQWADQDSYQFIFKKPL